MRDPIARVAAVLALVLLVAACGDDQARDAPAVDRPFAPTSAWNRPLPADQPLHPRSRQLVAELRRQVRASGAWINTDTYSVPVYRVPRDQPRVHVRLDTTYPQLARQFRRVPVPRVARPARGSDRHMVVWQPSTDTMWEFWLMRRAPDGWHARWGGRMTRVSRDEGAFPAPLGATATGLPLLGGLMRPAELRRGRIEHALAFALPTARAGTIVPPATRTDGQSPSRGAIPLGTRFRIDPGVDLEKLGLPGPTLAMARAVQRYGMIARDKSGTVSFYAEAPRSGRPNPYRPVFQGRYPDQLLKDFPWEELEVVRP
jgi:hypothetical protein